MRRDVFIWGLKSNVKMSEKERQHTIKRIIDKYGKVTQSVVCMEELAELSQQISKQVRGFGDRIGTLEEMADAYICLECVKKMYEYSEEDIQKAVDVKLMWQKARNMEG